MKLVPVPADKVIRVLEKAGFVKIRQKGSHVILKRGEKTTVVPVHKNEDIRPALLLKILSDTEITRDEFLESLGK